MKPAREKAAAPKVRTFDKPVATCSEDDYQEHCDSDDGLCLDCGEWSFGGIEPDAEDYKCGECGAMAVYGVEQALLVGALGLDDDEDEDGDEDEDEEEEEGDE